MVTIPTVLVVGGSGLAGGHIASALLEQPGLRVVLGARDEDRLQAAAAWFRVRRPVVRRARQ